MEAVLTKLITDLNGSVFVLIVILGVVFWAMYKIGGMTTMFSGFKEKNNALDKNVETIKDSLANIKATTDLLYQSHLTTIKSHSPVSLTEKGLKISTQLKIEDKVSVHWDKISKFIDKKSPVNPYDIQIVSMEVSRECFDRIFSIEEQSEIKSFAYKTGINLLEIFPIIGVIVRDRFLTEKGISVDEIDVHDPNKNPETLF
jgi:hypothetical protein